MEKQEDREPTTSRLGGMEKQTSMQVPHEQMHMHRQGSPVRHVCVKSERCLETHGIKSKQFLVCKSHNLHRWHNKIDNLIDWDMLLMLKVWQ